MDAWRKEAGPRDHWWLALGLGLLAGVGGGLLWARLPSAWPALLAWGAGGLCAAALVLVPAARRPILTAVRRVTAPVGWLVSWLLLAAVYFALVTPLGWALRLAGRDPLRRRYRPDASSYWSDHVPDDDPESDFRQY